MKLTRPIAVVLPVLVALLPATSSADTVSSTTTTTTTGAGPGTTLPVCMGGALSIPQLENSSGRTTSQNPDEISQSDCNSGATLQFDYGYSGTQSNELEVWGLRLDAIDVADCISNTNRLDSDCRLIAKMTVGSGGKLYVSGKQIAKELLTGGSCNDTSDGDSTISVQLWIMAIPSGADATDYCTYTAALDLLGPSPPTDVTAGPGDGAVVVSFSAVTDPETIGYNVYCDDGTGVASQGGGGSGGTTTTTTLTTNQGGGGTAFQAGDHVPSDRVPSGHAPGGPQYLTAGAGGTNGVGGSGGTTTDTIGAGGSLASCTFSSVLVEGDIPDPNFLVINAQNSSQFTPKYSNGKAMVNGKEYACGIAALDAVGNVGPLSNIVCGIPEPIDDFFGQYRGDSGIAGGGLCSMGQSSSAFAAMSAAMGISLLAFAGRRRSRHKRRRGGS